MAREINEVHPTPPRRGLTKSYNILVAGKTIDLEPNARFGAPGHLYNMSKSAVRALEVLEIFSTGQRPRVKAIDVSKILNISPSSTDQLLKTLVDSAFLIFDPVSKFYCPSPRLSNLAKMLSLNFEEDASLEALLETISERFGLLASLVVSQGTYMQIVNAALSRGSFRSQPSVPVRAHDLVGLRVPLFGSTTGAAWLSTQSDVVVRDAISMCRRELGSLAKDPQQILASLDRVRREGYAFGGVSPGNDQFGLSVPLPPSRHGVVLVIAVSGPQAELEEGRAAIAGFVLEQVALLKRGPSVA
jgi:DNA-binding IclR family transcriptional regulator